MLTDSEVLVDAPHDMFLLRRPADGAKSGEPTRERNVAKVAPAVDDPSVGKQDVQKADVKVIVRHLVGDPSFSAAQAGKLAEITRGRLSGALLVEAKDAVERRAAHPADGGERVKALPCKLQLAGGVNPGMTRQDLLEQSRPRTWQTDYEYRKLALNA